MALDPAAAAPPPMARPPFDLAKSWAIRLTVSAGTSALFAAAATSTSFTASLSVAASASGDCSPSSRITRRMASATSPSVPGAFRSHSSALAPVMDSRGSICTKVPARPWAKACMRAKPPAYATGWSQVSRKSAPNESR